MHESVYNMAALKSMIAQLPALQSDSTEDQIGDALLSQLVDWIVHPPEGIEAWVDYVAKNGSRGMGSEIAHVREANDAVHLHFAEMKDRDESVPALHPINDREAIESVFGHDSHRYKQAFTDIKQESKAFVIDLKVLTDIKQRLLTDLDQILPLLSSVESAGISALKERLDSVLGQLDVLGELENDQSAEALQHVVQKMELINDASTELMAVINAIRDTIGSKVEHK